MTPYIFIDGVFAALIVVVLFVLIRRWASFRLQDWGHDLTRETHHRLQQSERKLDAALNALERIERTTGALNSALRSLRSDPPQGKNPA